MQDEPSDEIDKNVARYLEYFADRSNRLFAYYFCIFEFQNDDDYNRPLDECDRTWRLKSIKDSCLHTTLIALRDLDDFLSPRTDKTMRDDLRASDFMLAEDLRFLTKEERICINKYIAHTTSKGAENAGYRWDIHEMISKAIAQCDVFLEMTKSNYGLKNLNTFIMAGVAQAKTKAIWNAIQKEFKTQ